MTIKASTDAANAGNRARVRRYRAKHRRIDDVPSPEVQPDFAMQA